MHPAVCVQGFPRAVVSRRRFAIAGQIEPLTPVSASLTKSQAPSAAAAAGPGGQRRAGRQQPCCSRAAAVPRAISATATCTATDNSPHQRRAPQPERDSPAVASGSARPRPHCRETSSAGARFAQFTVHGPPPSVVKRGPVTGGSPSRAKGDTMGTERHQVKARHRCPHQQLLLDNLAFRVNGIASNENLHNLRAASQQACAQQRQRVVAATSTGAMSSAKTCTTRWCKTW